MKKIYLYTGLIAAAAAFASCQSDDYSDWANPLTNPQEESTGAVKATIVASASNIAKDAIGDSETVPFIEFTGATNFDVSIVTFKKVYVNGNEIPFTQGEEDVTVSAAALDSVVCVAYKSVAAKERELTVSADISVADADGVSVTAEANDVTIAYMPSNVIPERHQSVEDAYYYVGGINGWNLTGGSNPMTANGDGSFSAILEVGDSEWFAFAPKSAVESGNWDLLFRAPANGLEPTKGFFADNTANSFCIAEGGLYKFTIWPEDYYYEVSPYSPTLYYVGDATGWNEFMPMVQNGENYEGYYYIEAADNSTTWGFKFTQDPSWDNPQWGAGSDASSIALNGGNIQISESGFYKIAVNTNEGVYSLLPITSLSLIGSAVNGDSSWQTDYDLTYNKETKDWEGTFEMTDGEFKIRANHDWTISWGGSLREMTTQNGANISITAGTYSFIFKPNTDGQGVLEIAAQ